jgi:hypothetical protein
MSQFLMPKSVEYEEKLPSLPPNVQNYTQVVAPTNGSVFFQNQSIIIDLPSRGFIDPQSLYIRYKMSIATTAAATFNVLGCPLYAPFQRLDTYINSQIIDSVNDFNIVAHMWSNTFLGVNEKYGMQSGFGYVDPTPATVTLDELDGRNIVYAAATTIANGGYTVSGPLVCNKLSGCQKLIPAFACGNIRLVFTLDSIANFIAPTTNFDTGNNAPQISNFEVVYDMIDFGSEFEQEILAKPSIMISSSGYNESSVSVPVGTVGTQTFVFNQRFSSIRSAILLPSATAVGTQLNGKFDSMDITSNGYYSLTIGGQTFPQGGPINFALNRSGALSELRKATGSLYDWSKSMAINNVEFSYLENTGTAVTQPGKVYVGFDLNKINSMSMHMMNGTSSQNTPINAVLQITTATAGAKQLCLVLNYDCVLIIDPRTRQVTVQQ